MIVTLRMEAHNVDESIGTLRFAQRAKAIPVRLRSSSVFQGEVGQVSADLHYALQAVLSLFGIAASGPARRHEKRAFHLQQRKRTIADGAGPAGGRLAQFTSCERAPT